MVFEQKRYVPCTICVDIIHERRVMYKLPSLCLHLNLHTYGKRVEAFESGMDMMKSLL